MTRILIVRHGETDWNADARVQGHTDVPMNDAGRRQVATAAAALAGERVAAVYASDLCRAAETGAILAAPHGLTVLHDADLRERNWGSWQGRAMPEIAEQEPELYARLRAGEWVTPDGAEAYEPFQARVAGAMQRIASAHCNQTVVVATHGGPVKAFTVWALGAPISAQSAMRTSNAAITTFLIRNGRWVLESYNVTAHVLEAPVASPGKALIESAF
ncbi:MAG TPA: histidine phosphatase family protein [Armatimonadota bacterium]